MKLAVKLVAIVGGLIALGVGFMSINPPYSEHTPIWLPYVFFVLAFIALLYILLDYFKTSSQKNQRRIAKEVRKNPLINEVLNTVEAIDNVMSNSVKELDSQMDFILARNIQNMTNKVSSLILVKTTLRHSPWDLISNFMDDNNVGLITIMRHEEYKTLNLKLEGLLRLQTLEFRNAVYDNINLWHSTLNCLLFFHAEIRFGVKHSIANSNQIRKFENIRSQGLGNTLTMLALKLGKESIK